MQVTPADIASAMGRPSPSGSEVEQWSVWIGDAYLILRIGDKAHAGLDLDAVDAEALRYVVREAVIAHLRRPDDATQVDIAVDDGRVSRTYSSAAGRVTIRPEWWDMLNPSEASGAFTISPASEGPGYSSWPRPGWC